MKYFIFLFFATTILLNYSCEPCEGCTDPSADNYDEDAEEDDGTCEYKDKKDMYDAHLFANYRNPISEDPTLVADLNLSSSEINIEEDPTVTESGGRIIFNYNAVTFKENKNVYKIDDLITERKNNEKWIMDDENKLSWTFSKSLDIILVLDVSSSLGNNIESVKKNAREFVSTILNTNDEAKIGILKFSRGSVFQDFSSDEQTLKNFIEASSVYTSQDIGEYELEGRDETALYESVNEAIIKLKNSGARGQGILTFTDGINNFWFDPIHFTPNEIINKLNDSNISSYTIGYDGNQGTVDKISLENISINGDFSFPNNITELNNVFLRFSNSVAAVYDLIYNTNNSKFDGVQEYRFLFNTTLISE